MQHNVCDLNIFIAALASLCTRVAAKGQLSSGRVGLSDTKIPVFVDPHCGSVGVPAGMGEQEVLVARQHLKMR